MADGSLQGYDALRARFDRLRKMDGRLMRMLLLQAEREAKQRAARRTGNLQRSIGSQVVNETTGRLFARAGYAPFVENGTGPHDITPNAKKALRWAGSTRLTGSPVKGASDVHFARRVHHPGTAPAPFLKPGAEAAITGAGLANEIHAVWSGKTEGT